MRDRNPLLPKSSEARSSLAHSGGWATSHVHYLLLSLAVWLVATMHAWSTMAADWWNDPNYSHGLLIVPAALYFVWRARGAWQSIQPSVSTLGLFFFGGASVLYLLGSAAAEHFTTRVAAVAGIGGLVWALLGWRFVRTVWFPLVFLFFAVPWPYVIYYQLTFPLQLFSTKVACAVLEALGVTLSRQGNIIHLPGYSLEVVEACSGVRSLLSMCSLGAAYAYLSQPGYVRPWLLFILSAPIALGANILRLVVTAIAARIWGSQVAEGFLHELGGLLLFGVALVTLVLTGSIISWVASRQSQPSR